MGVQISGYSSTPAAWPRVVRNVVTPAELLPVTLEDAKAFVKVDGDSDNANLDRCLRAATKKIERDTGLALMPQTIDFTFDRFSGRFLDLPVSPVRSVTSVKYTDSDGVLQTWGTSNYELDGLRVRLADGAYWPTDLRSFAPVVVRVAAGHVNASSIDDELIWLLLTLTGSFFETRQFTDVGAAKERQYNDQIARFRIALVA